jgi:hypothetical protein
LLGATLWVAADALALCLVPARAPLLGGHRVSLAAPGVLPQGGPAAHRDACTAPCRRRPHAEPAAGEYHRGPWRPPLITSLVGFGGTTGRSGQWSHRSLRWGNALRYG